MMRLWMVGGLVVGSLLVGCGDGGADPEDLSVAADLSGPGADLAQDLAPTPDAAQPADLMPPCDPDGAVPSSLACSGLYSDWNAKTLAAGVQAYAPGHALWSDGSVKSRFIQIPAGQKIDVTNPNDWVFPVGTRLWKEFRLSIASADKRIETRMWWKRGVGDWVGVVYRWSNDESNAPRLSTGEAAVGGTTYEVPAENRCVACHKQSVKTDPPLGFEAVLLADPAATGLTYGQLQTQALLTSTVGSTETIAASALQIPGSAVEKAALGYLYANCGSMCHRPAGGAPFRLDLPIIAGTTPANIQSTQAFAQIGLQSSHVLVAPPIMGATYYRLRVTDPMRSMIRLRMDLRDATAGDSGFSQMPPLVTHLKDTVGLAKIDAWIAAMTAAPYPNISTQPE